MSQCIVLDSLDYFIMQHIYKIHPQAQIQKEKKIKKKKNSHTPEITIHSMRLPKNTLLCNKYTKSTKPRSSN